MASNESEKMSTTQVENNRSLASKNRYNPTGRTKKMMFTKPIPTVALMLVTVTCLLCHVTGNSFGASVSISGGGGGGGAPGLPTSCGNCDMLKMMSIFGSHEDQMEGGKAVADECFGVKEEDHVLHFRACGDQKYRNECYVGKCLRELQEEYGDELKTNDATTHCDKWIETPSFICEETPFEVFFDQSINQLIKASDQYITFFSIDPTLRYGEGRAE